MAILSLSKQTPKQPITLGIGQYTKLTSTENASVGLGRLKS